MNEYQSHLDAAKNFTTLKHDARALRETFSIKLNDIEYSLKVEELYRRYNELIKIVPITTPKAFEKARTTIKAGIHTPDFKK